MNTLLRETRKSVHPTSKNKKEGGRRKEGTFGKQKVLGMVKLVAEIKVEELFHRVNQKGQEK